MMDGLQNNFMTLIGIFCAILLLYSNWFSLFFILKLICRYSWVRRALPRQGATVRVVNTSAATQQPSSSLASTTSAGQTLNASGERRRDQQPLNLLMRCTRHQRTITLLRGVLPMMTATGFKMN